MPVERQRRLERRLVVVGLEDDEEIVLAEGGVGVVELRAVFFELRPDLAPDRRELLRVLDVTIDEIDERGVGGHIGSEE